MRRLLFLTCIVLLVTTIAAAAGGYVVILKNGHKIPAREPLTIEGRYALITLVTGTVASYPLDQVDLVATERYNKLGLGSAITLDELADGGQIIPTPTPRKSLGSFAQIDAGQDSPALGDTAPPTPTPTPGITLKNQSYHEPRVDQAFGQILDERKLYQYRTSAGTQPGYFFIQAVTDTQREVFKTLKVVAEAYAVIHELHPEIAPEAIELEMVTLSNKPAGTFRITPELARELASNSTTVEQFYVRHVIF